MGRVHARAAREAGAEVAFVGDSDRARAAELARAFSARAEDVDVILRSGIVDVLHVCTPPATHGEILRRALEAGVHVICEKPVAGTAAELRDLFAIAEQRQVLLCPVYQFLFQRGSLSAISSLGSLGAIHHMTAEMFTAGADGVNARGRGELALDILSHPLSLSRAFGASGLGDVDWHAAVAAEGEMTVSGVCGSAVLTYVISTRGRPTSNMFRVIGGRGTVTLDLYHGFSFSEHLAPSRVSKLVRPFASSALQFAGALVNGARRVVKQETEFPGMRDLISRFYGSVTGRQCAPVTPEFAMDVAAARDAIAAAARYSR